MNFMTEAKNLSTTTAKPAVEQHAAKVLDQLIGPDRSQIRVRIRRRERVA